MQKRHRCVHCKRIFIPNPRIRNQRYCSDPVCQKARKAKWQRQKIATDEDYRLNQDDAHQRWRERHPGYYREYRQSHPDYRQRNRELQKYRDGKRRAQYLAKMDPLNRLKPINPGTYYLIPMWPNLAKMDALTQRITIMPASYKKYNPSCKIGLDRQTSVSRDKASPKGGSP